ARLPDRAVQEDRRRARRGERAERERREALRCRLVEVVLEREDVPPEPVEERGPETQPGVRDLRQVSVEVDQPGQRDPRSNVNGRREVRGRAWSRTRGGRPRESRPRGGRPRESRPRGG